MVGNTLLSPLISSRKGADPHRDDLIRKPDRGRRPITRSDQETMGSLDDPLVPSPQVRPVIEHQFPTSGGGDAMASTPPPRRGRDEGWGPSSAPRRGGHGSARPRCRRSCWHLGRVAWCLSRGVASKSLERVCGYGTLRAVLVGDAAGGLPERLEASRRREGRRIGPTLAGSRMQAETPRVIPETRSRRRPTASTSPTRSLAKVRSMWRGSSISSATSMWYGKASSLDHCFGESRPSRG